MKNFRLSAILVIVLFVFTSCGLKTIKDEDRMVKETKEEAEQLFEYLKNEDIESLSEHFCQNKKDESDLNEKWQVFFDEIDGKIISYDKYSCEENMRTFCKGELTYLVFNS